MKRTLPLLLILAACGGPETAPEPLRVDERAFEEAASPPAKDDGVEFGRAPLTLPGGTVLNVDVAATPEARRKGLMFRESLPDDYGMLFVFPSRRFLTFWMMNTFVDLDMVFIDENRRITGIQARVPRAAANASETEVARRSGVGRYVLELPAGAAERYGLAPGQLLRFTPP